MLASPYLSDPLDLWDLAPKKVGHFQVAGYHRAHSLHPS